MAKPYVRAELQKLELLRFREIGIQCCCWCGNPYYMCKSVPEALSKRWFWLWNLPGNVHYRNHHQCTVFNSCKTNVNIKWSLHGILLNILKVCTIYCVKYLLKILEMYDPVVLRWLCLSVKFQAISCAFLYFPVLSTTYTHTVLLSLQGKVN